MIIPSFLSLIFLFINKSNTQCTYDNIDSLVIFQNQIQKVADKINQSSETKIYKVIPNVDSIIVIRKYVFGAYLNNVFPYKATLYWNNCSINAFFFGTYFNLAYLICIVIPCILVITKIGFHLIILSFYYFISDLIFNLIIYYSIKRMKSDFESKFLNSINND